MVIYREEESEKGEPPHGHVTSISVLRSYRRLGLAKKLMEQSRTSLHCLAMEVAIASTQCCNLFCVSQKKLWLPYTAHLPCRYMCGNQIEQR